MFSNTFQSGFLSIFYSIGSSPLNIWDKAVKNGHIRRVVDDEVKSLVLEVSGTNVATTYITCPIKPRASLGIRLPYLVMVVKNMKKYFSFEIQILDDKDMRRRFRVSNFQSTTKVRPFCTTMPIGLSTGWNQIQFNLADFTKRAYGTMYMETMRVQIHANVRIRRIYFSDRLYSEEEMPSEYKLFLPASGSGGPRQSNNAMVKGGASKAKIKPVSTTQVGTKVEQIEQEVPSAAPPTPAGDQEPPSPVPELQSAPEAPSMAATMGEGEGESHMDSPETMDEGAESPVEAEGMEGEVPIEGEVAPEVDGEIVAEGEAVVEVPAEVPAEAPPAEEEAPPAE